MLILYRVCCADQGGVLPFPPQCWDYSRVPPHQSPPGICLGRPIYLKNLVRFEQQMAGSGGEFFQSRRCQLEGSREINGSS